MHLDSWMGKTELIDATKTWTELASELYGKPLRIPNVTFCVTGSVAGRAYFQQWRVDYNFELFRLNRVDFLNRTVPHEVAHLVTHTVHPGASAHGPEWRSVMARMGVDDITRCHSYDTSKLTRSVPRPYVYKCQCQEHPFTRTIHLRIKGGLRSYRCRRCKSRIIFSHDTFTRM